MLGFARAIGGVLSGLLLAGVVLGPARRPPDRAALLRSVRALPDHRRSVGDADPAARLTQDDQGGYPSHRTLCDSVCTCAAAGVDLGSCSSGSAITSGGPPSQRAPHHPSAKKRRSHPNDVHASHASLMRIRDQEKTVTWDSARKHQRPSRRLLFLLLLCCPAWVARRPQCAERPRRRPVGSTRPPVAAQEEDRQQRREVARLNSLQRDITRTSRRPRPSSSRSTPTSSRSRSASRA